MKMDKNKSLNSEEMKKVSGGVGGANSGTYMENYPTEQKTCPKCGSSKLAYKTFPTGDGKTGKIGQFCECGNAWTFGDKTSVL